MHTSYLLIVNKQHLDMKSKYVEVCVLINNYEKNVLSIEQ